MSTDVVLSRSVAVLVSCFSHATLSKSPTPGFPQAPRREVITLMDFVSYSVFIFLVILTALPL